MERFFFFFLFPQVVYALVSSVCFVWGIEKSHELYFQCNINFRVLFFWDFTWEIINDNERLCILTDFDLRWCWPVLDSQVVVYFNLLDQFLFFFYLQLVSGFSSIQQLNPVCITLLIYYNILLTGLIFDRAGLHFVEGKSW